jgi:hypothetical protein
MSEIFISHSSKDNAIAAELKHRLEAQGHTSVFLDFDPDIGIPPGRNWEQELYHKLRSCQAIIVLCSKDSMASQWVFAEITHAKALGKHIFPIKVGDCTINTVLMATQVLDLTANQEEAYQQLWRGLKSAGLDPANAFDWDGSRPPYPGLMAFQEADAAVFFGRDNEIHQGLELLNRLRQFGGARAVMVLGSSGSGKSSLVLAGLLPRLRRNKDQWLVVDPFRPQEHPFQELAIVLAAAFKKYGQVRDWRDICDSLQQAATAEPLSGNSLNDLAKDLLILANQREAKVLLVIDQTEELLGLTDSASVGGFLPLIRAALDTPNSPLMVICTMRSDFLGDFQQHPSAGNLALEDLWVGPMSVDRLVKVIEGPAEKAGVELEPGLTEALVKDTETEDALPLLAFTLRELYERYGDDRLLTIEEYRDKLGGLAGSVAKAADTVFRARPLSEEEKTDLRKSFLSMVRINEKGQFARRTARWAELPERIHPLLERFVKARLLVSRGKGRDRMLEVAHETIFSAWDQLRRWLDEDREFLLWRKRLDGTCREWERTRRDMNALLTGPALAEGQNWLDRRGDQLSPKESHFVRSSLEAAAKKHRRNVLVLSTAIIFLAVIAVGGLILWQQAELQKLIAEDQARVAIAGEWLEKDPTKAALVLLEVKKPDKTAFATDRMREVLEPRIALCEFREHKEVITAVSFSPSGDRVVTASEDGTARIWKADGSGEPVILEGHTGRVYAASFSPSGDRVVTASRDRTARICSLLSASNLQKAIKNATTMCLDPKFRVKYLGESREEGEQKYRQCEREHGRNP